MTIVRIYANIDKSVRLFGEGIIQEFGNAHSKARRRLHTWAETVRTAEWKHFAELKETFRSADVVEGFTVFNIGGNNYRLIATVNYSLQIVSVRHVLTHAEYDKGGWK